MAELYEIGVGINNDYKNFPVAVFRNPEITICGVHLRARDECDYIRKEQLSDLFQSFGTIERTNGCFTLPEEQRKNVSTKKAIRDKGGKIIAYKNSKLNTWKELENVIILGDFNMYGEHEQAYIPNVVTDVWQMLRPNEEGYTLSYHPQFVGNMMENHIAGKQENKDQLSRVRLDRILLSPRQGVEYRWKPTTIEHIGTQAIELENDDNVLYPSDHIGLVMEIQYE
jgi:endonuclease/exonuclease/phosphatase family metal-dependent hydrolase